jgi:ADP-ribosylglycohydrolase
LPEVLPLPSPPPLPHRLAEESQRPSRAEFLDLPLPYVPPSAAQRGIRKARDLDIEASVSAAVSVLGNGSGVGSLCPGHRAFRIVLCGTHLANYEEAICVTISGLGDRDTTCATVGGIVAMHAGADAIPDD